MDIEKAGKILAEATERLVKEADVPVTHMYSLSVPESGNPVFVVMFSDSSDACRSAVRTIEKAK